MLEDDQARSLLQILELVRSGQALTRPDLARATQFGRAVVTSRLEQLLDLGLVAEGDLLPVPRGRSPRGLHFNTGRGHVLCADIGARSMFVGLSDLGGRIVDHVSVEHDISLGPEQTLTALCEEFDKILARAKDTDLQVWAIGLGVPGPIEHSTGLAVSPPIMPGWGDLDVRRRLQDQYGVPVWVDNDVNVMALGELNVGNARHQRDVVVVKLSTGIGAGLISNGVLHRGAQGSAGDIGHVKVSDDPTIVCRCGNTGCLEALASSWALGRQGQELVDRGESSFLVERTAGRAVTGDDVVVGAISGDHLCMKLMSDSARLVGDTLALVVNFYNPALVLLGGRLMAAGDAYLATVRNIVYSRSLPLATRELVIGKVGLGSEAALHGAAALALEEVFRPEYFADWAGRRSTPQLLPTAT
ncbi:ROK family protein [Nocardioides aquiterrae]|uniref:ROK family transcriptional regulator n=1 Tax=Nocardioides aquiterrae TaxID=203799 RepID=A0ABP4EVN2_9ACTN